ncbi:cysteine--tRNA ligase [Candidatus Nitrotoga sp. HW29]|uniref:cysteine--tRNA ligase n=1 Tax=Candidatus Nitrotoga sp. HW29 TaxID=2886963 RepID=UPI001EF281D3|nr:cysteine--tRNA ligase [Candidatus Nitrotoga sp. HW29]CAH1906471.1 cysteine--tRNA ligase [Candidatus Nitrotoga sp. HW29]
MLKIYNTLTRDKQDFIPIEPGKVRMYVCGMTVYDYCHLGHARVMVAFDMVYRWLKTSGLDVTYVRNITDIDDKIIKRAAENAESIHALTQRFIDAMHEDERALGILPPDFEPRATQYIPQMLDMIAKLEANGLAYQAADGDMNYAVRKFANYGKLSGKTLADLRAGERVEVNDGKLDPLDFVLWKHAKESEPDEVKWDSPWGEGRPGWHIECSAMSLATLGKHFDIHGGGADLQFPHHENEIAQSEGACQCKSVNVWMHNGFVRVDNEKMSKSLGNFFTIREVLKKYNNDAEMIRFFILRAHYRSQLNYSDAHLDDAKQSLRRLYTALKNIAVPIEMSSIDWNEPYSQRFKTAMDDDFNTPEAMAVLFDLANEVNRDHSLEAAKTLKALGGVLGLLQQNSDDYLQGRQILAEASATASAKLVASAMTDFTLPGFTKSVQALIAERTVAKQFKNFAESDRIRKELLEAGIVLEDSASGTTWRRA